MTIDLSWTWPALLLLGAFHGINPGMGWLFAVALGLQDQRRTAVWRALLPLALGHALAIAAAIGAVALIGQAVPLTTLKWVVAGTLLVFGAYRLVRTRHPRYGGMRVGARDLTIWSFLMASAHGAGLMVLPFLFGPTAAPTAPDAHADAMHAHHAEVQVVEHAPASAMTHQDHGGHAAALMADLPDKPVVGLLATLLHTVGYLLIMGLVAIVVYEKLGLRLLRSAWLNLDLVWSVALIATAGLTLLL